MRWWERDPWIELAQVLLRNPFRTFLSSLGVGWGLFMILITVGASNGLEEGVKSDMGNRVKNSAFLWGESTSLPYKGYPRGRWIELTSPDVEYLVKNATTLEVVAPRNQLGGWRGGNNVTHGLKTAACGVYGDMPVYKDIDPILITEGRYINQRDLDDRRKVAVIGKRVRQLLFDREEQVLGSHIQIQGVTFTVVGVYKSQQTGEDAEEAENSIFTPYTTFNHAFHMGDKVGWLSLLIKEDVPGDTAVAEVLRLLKAQKSIHPDDPRGFGHWSMAEMHEEMSTVFAAFRWVSFVFGGLALFAGVIGIMNIMLITIKERTRELGVRRALGATPANIVVQIMVETLTLTVLAGLLGGILGVFALEALDTYLVSAEDNGIFRHPHVTLDVLLTALTTMTVLGAFAGVLPALRALRVQPVEALRT
ncbi:MAG TPA: multidrug ABC transporter ATP-binding protein [Flavobacteriales bacterium]|nr:multidrug ABC transporter ATP-binding protein [Flavobacteriales bacterium]